VGNDANDTDGSPIGAIDEVLPGRRKVNRQYTNEVQILGSILNDRLNWIVGGLLDETRQPGGNNTINVQLNTFEQPGFAIALLENRYTSHSAFGSATYKITDPISLTAGYRYSWDDIGQISAHFNTANDVQVILPGTPITALTHGYGGASYNVNLDYQATSRILVYGGYRRGYKRGGFNITFPNPEESLFKPETVDDYFAGVKTDFMIARIQGRFNVEAFYDKYHDAQRSYLSYVPDFGLTAPIQNARGLTYRGFDTDFELALTRWLLLTGSYSFLDAYYTSWPDTTVPGTAGDLTTNPVSFSPRSKFSVTARFHAYIPDDKGELVFAPTVSYQSREYIADDAARLENATAQIVGRFNAIAAGGETVRPYALVGLRLEWNDVAASKIRLAANVTNLLNKVYILGATQTLQFGAQSDTYGPPRMFTAEASVRF
jgi:iron complex outermembrane receptor protein